MQICQPIPFIPEQLYCYPPVVLSAYDKLFLIVIVSALVAILIDQIERKFK